MPKYFDNGLDEQLAFERVEEFSGGMDAYHRATQLAPNASQYLENIFIPENGEAGTRPGADKLGSTFLSLVQGLFYYDKPGFERLVAAVEDKIYTWSGSAWTDTTKTVTASARVDMAQGIETLLLTDGTAPMKSWDGASDTTNWTTHGTSAGDPPQTATILLWHGGRMWAAGFPGTTVGKEADALYASNLLAFGNGEWDGLARNWRIGVGDGDPIMALASIQDDYIAILKENSIWLFQVNAGTVLPSAGAVAETLNFGTGAVGRRAHCVFGNDLLYISRDKSIRSLRRMQAAANQWELSSPLSINIQPWVDRINWTYAHLCAAVKYRELALFSVPLDSSTYPNTVLAWNGRLQQWVGVWTGWTPNSWAVTRFGGVHRLVHGDNSGNVRQWKEYQDPSDARALDDSSAITTKLHSRAFLFGEPLNDKNGYHSECRFSEGNAAINVSLVADDETVKTWVESFVIPDGPYLPVNLPFNLGRAGNKPFRKGLRSLGPWNEAYLKLESTSGWWSLRNMSLSAFINTLANESVS